MKKPEEEKKEEKKKPEKVRKKESEKKSIVRLMGTDIDGEKKLRNALREIKGIGHSMSKAICVVSGIDPERKLASLSDKELQKLESIIKNPLGYGIPSWLVNRRRDPETGEDYHLTGLDLKMKQEFDIKKMIELKTYKGFRHMYGLPVRGQRTRSHFRKGRTVGVVKKSVRIAQQKSKEKK